MSLPTPKTDAEKRRLETAIQHASLIQEQKDIQKQNLNAIERLSLFPAQAEPTPEEQQTFTTLVNTFQPSDYDALVEERHANGLCGYTLCPNAPRKRDPKHPWRNPKGWSDWCSETCARAALYVKAQLNEVPAWERRCGEPSAIVLQSIPGRIDLPIRTSNASGADALLERKTLALERGETGAVTKIDRVVLPDIVENAVASGGQISRRFEDLVHDSSKAVHGQTDLHDFSD